MRPRPTATVHANPWERGPKNENAAEVSQRRSLKTKGPAAFATGLGNRARQMNRWPRRRLAEPLHCVCLHDQLSSITPCRRTRGLSLLPSTRSDRTSRNDHGPSVCPGRGGSNSGCAVSAERAQRRRRAASRPPRPRTAAAPGVGMACRPLMKNRMPSLVTDPDRNWA